MAQRLENLGAVAVFIEKSPAMPSCKKFLKHCADQFEHDEVEPIKLRITGVIAELERRRVELENLHAQKREIEKRLEPEGLSSTAKPDIDIPVFIEQLKNQARAANALRPRLLEALGKAYWQHERDYHPDTRGDRAVE